jgi:hypothetical protein
MFGGPFQAVSRVYGVRAWISITHLDESRWHAGTVRSGSFVMVGLVGLKWRLYILRHLYYITNEGKSQLILVKRENAETKGRRKAHRTYPFTLITTTINIITSALLSHVHPTVAVLRRLGTQNSVMGLVKRSSNRSGRRC